MARTSIARTVARRSTPASRRTSFPHAALMSSIVFGCFMARASRSGLVPEGVHVVVRRHVGIGRPAIRFGPVRGGVVLVAVLLPVAVAVVPVAVLSKRAPVVVRRGPARVVEAKV